MILLQLLDGLPFSVRVNSRFTEPKCHISSILAIKLGQFQNEARSVTGWVANVSFFTRLANWDDSLAHKTRGEKRARPLSKFPSPLELREDRASFLLLPDPISLRNVRLLKDQLRFVSHCFLVFWNFLSGPSTMCNYVHFFGVRGNASGNNFIGDSSFC